MGKTVNRCVQIILFILCFLACGRGWNYILVDDTRSYTRVMMNQLYETKENIDVIFVGSSHVYRSLIPSITDCELGNYTFNMGTSSQDMDGSLALIREAAAYNDLSHVYLEVYYEIAEGSANYSERTEMTGTYIISDYMRPSLRRMSYLLQATPKEHWVNGFIIPRREWTKVFDFDYVKNLIKKKQTDNYKNYILQRTEGQSEYYVDRGFVANNNVVSEEVYCNSEAYGPIMVNHLPGSDWENSLLGAIDYCKKHNIEITLFVVPEPEWTIVGKGNYQDYHDYVRKLADSQNVGFYDFNLCSNAYFDANDRKLFKDEDHLNTCGAEEFSHLFGQFFGGKIKADDLFYTTYAEKLNAEGAAVYGFAGPGNDPKAGLKDYYMISNVDSGIEYSITAIPSERERYCVQDFNENKRFSLPAEETGRIEIAWRSVTDLDDVQTFCGDY